MIRFCQLVLDRVPELLLIRSSMREYDLKRAAEAAKRAALKDDNIIRIMCTINSCDALRAPNDDGSERAFREFPFLSNHRYRFH